jgi:DNA (cytosine-5)-methyltransferase 1
LEDLKGKQIKDKRGGANNIHSWDLEIKGPVSDEQKKLLNELLKQRRRKSWSVSKGIPWSDGMPLTLDEIKSFYMPFDLFNQSIDEMEFTKKLEFMLEDLVTKGYVVKELPKKVPEGYKELGYNIVVGKLSFEISNILDSDSITPTLVATDVTRLAVADKKGLRRLTIREGLRLFGFPEDYQLDGYVKNNKAFDLLGNSVSVGVISLVAERLIKTIYY